MSDFTNDLTAIQDIPPVKSILEIVCKITGMGFSVVARVTDSNWVACATLDVIKFGIKPGEELPIETTLCREVKNYSKIIAVDNFSTDAVYAQHHTPAIYGLQSYISVPIITKNYGFFGTLCAFDPNPAKVNNDTIISLFQNFAALIAFHLEAKVDLEVSNKKLKDEKELSELREQFISILGHDLRNPLGAIVAISQILKDYRYDAKIQRIAAILENSSNRMKFLIDHTMDFAHGHLGRGLGVNMAYINTIEDVLTVVIDEMQALWPNREIQSSFQIDSPLYADSQRMAQLLSNLISNALYHGSPNTPVIVKSESMDGVFKLSVINQGNKIPSYILEKLFQPFFRGNSDPDKKGLGLGLFIASEIARGHRGSLTVESSENRTCFTLTMPAEKENNLAECV